MIWVAWRQHRAQLIALAVVLVTGVIAVSALHASMAGYIAEQGMRSCVAPAGERSAECLRFAMEFQPRWLDPLKAGQAGILALPVLLGVFSAAPLFAREIENGTHVLVFTQSVSRVRWMAAKVAMVLVPALITVVVLQFAVQRWVSAAGELGPLTSGPFTFLNLDTSGPLPVAHLLFSFGLGALLGTALKRPLPAMISTLGALVVVRAVATNVHPHLSPVRREVSGPSASTPDTGDSLVDSGYLDAAGNPLPDAQVRLNACGTRGSATEAYQDPDACLREQGIAGRFHDVIPAEHAPVLQWAEFALFGAAGVLLLVATAWLLRKQH
ncbi:hypothetical protein [Saccharopolyspora sp. NPDC002578]